MSTLKLNLNRHHDRQACEAFGVNIPDPLLKRLGPDKIPVLEVLSQVTTRLLTYKEFGLERLDSLATKHKTANKKSVQNTSEQAASVDEGKAEEDEIFSVSQEAETFNPGLTSQIHESFIFPANSSSTEYLNHDRPDLIQLQTLITNLDTFSKLMDELGSIPQLAENLAEVKLKLDALLPLRSGQEGKGREQKPGAANNPLLVPGVTEALIELTNTLNALVTPQFLEDSANISSIFNLSTISSPGPTQYEVLETGPNKPIGTQQVNEPEIDLSKAFVAESAIRQINGILRNPEVASTKGVHVLSSAWYHATREALSHNTFKKTEDSPWPTALINKGGASGKAQLVPPAIENHPLMPAEDQNRWAQLMWKQRQELSDLDADALDMLCHFWLIQAKKPEDSAVAVVDEFLEMRGLKKKMSGNGRRGGYMPDQRLEMLKALSHIQSIWLNFGQIEIFEEKEKRGKKSKYQSVNKEVQSRAFVVTDRLGQLNMDGYMDVERFIYRPGEIFAKFLFGPGRQTALLSAQAIQYDPLRQKWEKRLARYLSWQWRIQANRADFSRPYRVETLLKAVGDEINVQRPQLVRDRLEKALDRLQQDEVISSWEYDRWDERLTERQKWLDGWLDATVLIEPPNSIRETYKSLIRNGGNSEQHAVASSRQVARLPKKSIVHSLESENDKLITQLKETRKSLRISQAECANELGIAQGFLSRLENGKENLSEQLKPRLKEWLLSKHARNPS